MPTLRLVLSGLLLTTVALSAIHSANKLRAADEPEQVTSDSERSGSGGKGPWSFNAIRRPPVPEVGEPSWVRNPIDAFILAKLESEGIKPAEPAKPIALLRRVSFDLTGLPPTLEAIESFKIAAARRSEVAFGQLVDRLLASPRYGERWARHWLDLVRYADSNGYEVDGAKPLAWKYRDYVIRSLNRDTPYDRFVMEQLAGDELLDASSETVIATGFYRVGPWDAERGASVQPSEMVEERFNELDDMVSTTSQVFLGLTLGCARCHDHKFDPLTSQDYYSMVAIFSPLTRHRNGRAELTRPAAPHPELLEKNRADRRITELKNRIRTASEPLRRGLLESGNSKLTPDAVTALLITPDQRSDNQKQLVRRFSASFDQEVARVLGQEQVPHLAAEVVAEIRQAETEIKQLESSFRAFPQGYFLYEPSPNPAATHLLVRGDPDLPGDVVGPDVPRSVRRTMAHPTRFDAPDQFTSRRRFSLARWITDVQNPLTARVIVNRVWQYHFGVGLCRTPSDFGHRGTAPTHPKLLDWLADWFIQDANWSLKGLHRLILTSSTYQMSKSGNESYDRVDPANLLFWRFPYRRLEVEAIRDSVLAVSGRLNGTLYGPGMYMHIPDDARRSGYDPKAVWKQSSASESSKRTIYAYLKRTLVVPFLDTLDFCDTTRSAERRQITTIAPQALELLNGEFVNRQAEHFADRLIREAGTNVDAQISLGFRLALGRTARIEEQQTLRGFWNSERDDLIGSESSSQGAAERTALIRVCRVVFNLNEFVYTD